MLVTNPLNNAPIFLADRLSFDLTLANGQTQVFSSQNLSNNYGCPYAIDELRFFVFPKPITPQNAKLWLAYDWASIFTANMRVGQQVLTKNPVHLRTLGTRYQDLLSLGSQAATDTAKWWMYASTAYRCVLPSPLMIPRSGSLDVEISLDKIADRPVNVLLSNMGWSNVDVWVAAVGRLLPHKQAGRVPYPYFAEFATKISYDPTLAPGSALANNPTFLNSFSDDLLIQKFVAGLYTSFPNDTSITNSEGFWTDTLPTFAHDVKISAWDSRGQLITPGQVPLGIFVDARTGDWNFSRILSPRQWLNVELYAQQMPLAQIPDQIIDDQPVYYPRVGIVGTVMGDFTP